MCYKLNYTHKICVNLCKLLKIQVHKDQTKMEDFSVKTLIRQKNSDIQYSLLDFII